MDDTSLKEYFVFSFQKKNEKPLFSIKIKKKFGKKIRKESIFLKKKGTIF